MVTTTLTELKNPELVVGREPVKTTAYIMYRGERVDVKVTSTFRGGTGLMANVETLKGYPFLSSEVNSQGKTFGAWNCNGRRVRADFVYVEVAHDPEDYQPHPAAIAYDIEHEEELLKRESREIDLGIGSEWKAEMTARHADALDEERTMREAAQ